MTTSALRRRISERLKGRVNPDLFEQCAQDLLRVVYPGLVPVTGGSDQGYDGAIRGDSGQIPLVCTTGKDVVRNVTKNLKQARPHQKEPRYAVAATTQSLNQGQRQSVFKAAEKQGFTLLQIHDRADFINLLWRNPRWRQELLGLAGDPGALSKVPSGARFDAGIPIVGREEELAKLCSHSGDLLVVGQPGSGKTFLHQHLAREGQCLFVVSDDLGEISDAIQELKPQCLVVDDAHTRLPLVENLRRLRYEAKLAFHLHLNCWPDSAAQCRSALSMVESDVVHLDLLTRDQIVAVLRGCGVARPKELVELVLDQAGGKPGLAVILAEALKKGDGVRVWIGETLAEYLLAGRKVTRDERERTVLAAFALGGEAGMPAEAVARVLRLEPFELRQIVTGLGAGGVIEDCGQGRLAVTPSALRWLLVKQVFFTGPLPVDPSPLIAAAPVPAETAQVLLGARQRGADIGVSEIDALFHKGGSERAWRHFAYADEECARHVLSHHADKAMIAADGLLHHLPELVIPILLERAGRDNGSDKLDERPLQHISEWVMGSPLKPGHIERRKQLLEVIESLPHPSSPKVEEAVGRALQMVMSAAFAANESEPGSGMNFVFRRGVYGFADLKTIAALWDRVHAVLKRAGRPGWIPVLHEVERWCHPASLTGGKPLPATTTTLLRRQVKRMLRDVALRPNDRAVRMWVRRVAANAKFTLSVENDADYEILFGSERYRRDYKKARDEHTAALTALARRLAARQMTEVLDYLGQAEKESAGFDLVRSGHGRWWVYRDLAELAADPAAWVMEMTARKWNAHYVEYFLRRAVKRDRAAASPLLQAMLENEPYRYVAAMQVLELDPPDDSVRDRVVAMLGREVTTDDFALSRLSMPISTRRVLLEHPNAAVRGNAAVAESTRHPEGEIPADLQHAWMNAILTGAHQDDHHLLAAFVQRPSMAFEWLKGRFVAGEEYWNMSHEGTLMAAAKFLDRDQRAELLSRFTVRGFSKGTFRAIVGDDLTLFKEWCGRCSDPYLRTMPLRGAPNERWIAMAQIAMDCGATPEDVADAAMGRSYGWSGSVSEYYGKLSKEYEELLSHPDTRLHATARRGMEMAQRRVASGRQEEREEEVFGVSEARHRRSVRSGLMVFGG